MGSSRRVIEDDSRRSLSVVFAELNDTRARRSVVDRSCAPAPPRGRYLLTLSIAALGIVFGDIGTSPLYAVRECLHGPHGIDPSPANVLGVLSLIFWSLVDRRSRSSTSAYVLRADNRGEGGILALMALAMATARREKLLGKAIVALGLFGAALLYGDGMITPAISVLSAVEGLELAAPELEVVVVPLTVVILVGVFAIQRRGTAGVGAMFGPVTLRLVRRNRRARNRSDRRATRGCLLALSPTYAIALHQPWHGGFLPGSRSGVSGGHRRRGALRRHGPFRRAPDSTHLVRRGSARAGSELLRPGRTARSPIPPLPTSRSFAWCRLGRSTR